MRVVVVVSAVKLMENNSTFVNNNCTPITFYFKNSHLFKYKLVHSVYLELLEIADFPLWMLKYNPFPIA